MWRCGYRNMCHDLHTKIRFVACLFKRFESLIRLLKCYCIMTLGQVIPKLCIRPNRRLSTQVANAGMSPEVFACEHMQSIILSIEIQERRLIGLVKEIPHRTRQK